jgi:hypothetical protein
MIQEKTKANDHAEIEKSYRTRHDFGFDRFVYDGRMCWIAKI